MELRGHSVNPGWITATFAVLAFVGVATFYDLPKWIPGVSDRDDSGIVSRAAAQGSLTEIFESAGRRDYGEVAKLLTAPGWEDGGRSVFDLYGTFGYHPDPEPDPEHFKTFREPDGRLIAVTELFFENCREATRDIYEDARVEFDKLEDGRTIVTRLDRGPLTRRDSQGFEPSNCNECDPSKDDVLCSPAISDDQ